MTLVGENWCLSLKGTYRVNHAFSVVILISISCPEAAILLVSTKDHLTLGYPRGRKNLYSHGSRVFQSLEMKVYTEWSLRNPRRDFQHRTSDIDIWHRTWQIGASDIRHRTSDIGHRTSDIRHQTSDIGHRASNIRTSDIRHRTSDIGHRTSGHQTLGIRHRTSDVSHRTSVFKHRTSDIRHQTSDIRHQTSDIGQLTTDIGHQTSDVSHQTSGIGHRT